MAQPSPDQDIAVLRVALDLAAVPSRRRQLLNSPLPEGVTFLLLIVTDDLGAIEASAKRMQKSPQKLREAAAFYIEQILLAPNANSYRVLVAQRSAAAAELRRNLRFLQMVAFGALPRYGTVNVFLAGHLRMEQCQDAGADRRL